MFKFGEKNFKVIYLTDRLLFHPASNTLVQNSNVLIYIPSDLG